MTTTVQTHSTAAARVRRRPSTGYWWAAMVVALALVGIVFVILSGAGPKPLPAIPSSAKVNTGPQARGETIVLHLGLVPPPNSGVPKPATANYTIDSISPVLERGSALATVTLVDCHGILSSGVEPLSTAMIDCYSWGPAIGSQMSVTPMAYGANSSVVALVTPLSRGTIHILGFKMKYHVGDRYGSSSFAGNDFIIPAK